MAAAFERFGKRDEDVGGDDDERFRLFVFSVILLNACIIC